MTLSRNEQIALYIVVFMVIAIAGFFISLMPEYNKIQPNKDYLEFKKHEYEGFERDLGYDKFQAIEENIMKAYLDGEAASDDFYEEELRHFEADKLIQEVLAEAEFNIDNLKINSLSTYNLSLSIFQPIDILYDIKVKAQIGKAEETSPGVYTEAEGGDTTGDTTGDSDTSGTSEGETSGDSVATDTPYVDPNADPKTVELEEMLRQLTGASRQTALEFYEENMKDEEKAANVVEAMRKYLSEEGETVMVQNVSFEIPLSQEEVDKLSMHIYELEKATYILNLTYSDINGTMTGPSGETVQGGFNGKKLYNIEIMFLIVHPMDEPSGQMVYKEKFDWNTTS